MQLANVPIHQCFTFPGFPKEVCMVEQRGHTGVKVLENNETSWYKNDREVVYPVQPYLVNLFIEKNGKFILQSKV